MQSNQTTRETILQVYVHPNLKYWSFARIFLRSARESDNFTFRKHFRAYKCLKLHVTLARLLTKPYTCERIARYEQIKFETNLTGPTSHRSTNVSCFQVPV